MSEEYFDKENISIKLVNKGFANDMISRYHYTHTETNIILSFGVYVNVQDKFFEEVEKLIGVLTYGSPVGRNVIQSISETLKKDEVLELTRLFIFDGYGKNVESYSISQSIKYIKKYKPKVKVLVSYSDPEQNHIGTIYQATNWRYQGDSMRIVDGYWYKLPDEDKWLHPRSVVGRFGSCTPAVLLDKYDEYKVKEIKRKHRYLYFTCDKKEKKNILKTLKYPLLPYPKKEKEHEDIIYTVRRTENGIQYIQEEKKEQ